MLGKPNVDLKDASVRIVDGWIWEEKDMGGPKRKNEDDRRTDVFLDTASGGIE